MRDYKNLPFEVLQNIFEKLGTTRKFNRKDIGQCSLTCRAWNLVAQPILFKHLRILRDLCIIDLNDILANSKVNETPGYFVKIIELQTFGSKIDFVLLDKLFPNLQAINIRYSTESICDKLYPLIMEGKFLNLKKLPFTRLDDAHLELLMARKEHIEELEFECAPYSEHIMNQISKNMHLFSKLNKFKLQIYHAEATICLETLFSQNLPALEVICISLLSPAKIIFKKSLNLTTIQTLPSVREVNIIHEFFRGGGISYFYFMKKFPNVDNLRSIFRLYEAPVISSKYKVPTVACLSDFLLYLYNIKGKCTMGPMVTNQNTTQVVETFFNQVLDQKAKTKKIRLHIALDIVTLRPGQNRLPYCTEYIEPSKIDRDNKNFFEVRVVYRTVSKSINPQPYLELFQRVGNMNMEHLFIGHNSWDRHTTDDLPVPLDVIFDHFINLKTLCIRGIWNITFSNEDKSKPAVESLRLKKCNLNQEIFPKISKTCPNLKMMKLSICYFLIRNERGNMQSISKTITIHMPFTNLRTLSLVVNLENAALNEYKRTFIRLKTALSKPRYCKLTRAPPPRYHGDYAEFPTMFDTRKKAFTEDDFTDCVNDKHCRVYNIYCESVKELNVLADKYGSKIYHEENI